MSFFLLASFLGRHGSPSPAEAGSSPSDDEGRDHCRRHINGAYDRQAGSDGVELPREPRCDPKGNEDQPDQANDAGQGENNGAEDEGADLGAEAEALEANEVGEVADQGIEKIDRFFGQA